MDLKLFSMGNPLDGKQLVGFGITYNKPRPFFFGLGIPSTYPVIGCLISFHKHQNRLLNWYTYLLRELAPNMILVRCFGAPRTIVTTNPENVEYMLKTNFDNFPKGKPFTKILEDFLGCDPSLPISPLAKAFDMASEVYARFGAAPLFIVWKIKRWLGVRSEGKLKDVVASR
ncbi:Cytochrome P450 94B3 [Morella rubra]|uniref:Cytochrome P450 94B3 n=1 Tax=Morella rubra TaxID=262757 RepID=A0A6A1WCL8_9ROSI|nr:Cytochrome P450 94B3 [Morella rubra]